MNLKKPKFWNYEKPNLLAYLLLPIALFLQLINLFKITSRVKPKIKTICIGNIYLGGTGKTSLAIKINDLLYKKNIRSCFVKKFYNNQTDEQELLKKRGKLFLSSNRLDAINKAETENYEIAILDDGLQDNSIIYDIHFVCFNILNGIGNGLTLPAGPLRENINNLKKYQYVFLNGNLENSESLIKKIKKINSQLNIYLAKYIPLNLEEFDKTDKYLAFSGIGNHDTFISMIKEYGLNIFKEIEFPDHYAYTILDIDKILNEAKKNKCKIITTEKDFLRLKNNKFKEIKYIKSELKILDEEKLLETIVNKI